MKKALLAAGVGIILLFAASCSKTKWYHASTYAYKYIDNDSAQWTEWTDWLACDIRVKTDLDERVIVIYSNKTQVYTIIGKGQKYKDSSGGEQTPFAVIDQDGDKGTIRLRKERNGNSQINIDFANASWVYNVNP